MREKTRSLRMFIHAVAVIAMLGMGIIDAKPDSTPVRHKPIVDELKTLLEVKPDLANALDEGIANAGIVGILSREEYYAFLDALVTWVPTERDLVPKILKFYYIVDQAPEDALNQDEQFNQWVVTPTSSLRNAGSSSSTHPWSGWWRSCQSAWHRFLLST